MNQQVSVRRGSSLIELLIALPVAAMIAAIACALLLRIWHLVRYDDRALEVKRELRHAHAALSADLRPLRDAELLAWSDSLLELSALVGSTIVCAAPSRNQIQVLAVDPSAAASEAWSSLPQPGDSVEYWGMPLGSGAAAPMPQRYRAVLAGAGLVSGCASSALLTARSDPRSWRLTLSDSLSRIPTPGTPLSLRRRVQYAHYRSGTQWFLGRRSWTGIAWDVIQPVAGPLHSAAAAGMRVSGYGSDGLPRPSGASGLAQLHINMRAPLRVSATSPVTSDSATLVITLRAQRGQRSIP